MEVDRGRRTEPRARAAPARGRRVLPPPVDGRVGACTDVLCVGPIAAGLPLTLQLVVLQLFDGPLGHRARGRRCMMRVR